VPEEVREAIPDAALEAGARAMAHVRHLAGAIGPRPARSAAEAAAAAYVRQALEGMGLSGVQE
jgi:hypothetical protein